MNLYLREAATGPKASSPKAVFEQCQDIANADQECLIVFLLNTQNEIIRRVPVSMGGVCETVADPKIIFNRAIRHGAVSIILAHNHPGGNPEPSGDDLATTKKIHAGGELLGIHLVDHVIVAGDRYISLAERGQICGQHCLG